MKNILLYITVLLTLISCKNTSEKKVETKAATTIEETVHTSENDTVELDNGNLWEANNDTTIGINKMINRLSSFTETENVAAYLILKEGLETDFTELFQKCTMKGEAHNQLHSYLLPMIDLFEGLESSEITTCKKNFNELKTHLESYTSYFE
jgi:hypothetical protein